MSRGPRRFPWHLAGWNVLLIALAFAGLYFLDLWNGMATGIGFLKVFSMTVWIMGSFAFQVFAFVCFEKRMLQKSWRIVIFLLPALLLVPTLLIEGMPSREAARILAAGRLSELPDDAERLRVYRWSGGFTCESFVGFEASTASIENFIKHSPSLAGIEPERLLPTPPSEEDATINEEHFEALSQHLSILPAQFRPAWFLPDDNAEILMYQIPSLTGHNSGQVFFDKTNRRLLIRVVWS